MDNAFVSKVNKIVLENLPNEKFGVTDLANLLGLSRSQLLRRIKSETGKSANLFIRECRLKESVKLLRNEENTVSEIAYLVGFNSPSYFNKCFLSSYGCTPGEYTKLHADKENEDNLFPNSSKTHRFSLRNIYILIILVLVSGTCYFGYTLLIKKSTPRIAVLPVSNFSSDKELDYLGDSFTDAITLELAKNEKLEVVSRTTAMLYKQSEKTISEIAKDLDLDLVLEGSFLVDSDSIRLVTQLIEPKPKEKHIWQKDYSHELQNLLQLTNTVSRDIASKIIASISAESTSKNLGTKFKIVDPNAYDLYIRGKYLYNQQNTASIKASLKYLQESIAIDSTYAPAYVTLGDAYITLNKIIPNNIAMLEHRDQCREAIDRALELDPTLASAYIAKGNILGKFDWQWEKMKEYSEKGLELDPNNARGYIILSNYYLIKGQREKAFQAVTKAQKLDPLNRHTGYLVGERLMLLGKLEDSKKEFIKVLELDPNYGMALDGLGYVYYIQGNLSLALKTWSKLHRTMGNITMADYFLEHSFDNSVKTLLSKVEIGNPIYCTNPTILAQANSFIQEDETALDFIDIAFKYRHEDLPLMFLKPHFNIYYENPRFMELVEIMDISLPPIPIKN